MSLEAQRCGQRAITISTVAPLGSGARSRSCPVVLGLATDRQGKMQQGTGGNLAEMGEVPSNFVLGGQYLTRA
jgi:hypothetical protein